MENKDNQRKTWLDFLRAVAILLVVFGHQIPGCTIYFVLTSPIKIPLFFAISGYLLKPHSFGVYLNKTFWRLIVPWIILGMLPVLLLMPVKGIEYVINEFFRLLAGDTIWFMPCFIIGSFIFYCIHKWTPSNLVLGFSSFIMFLLGLLMYKYNILDYGMINRAFAVQPFLFFGFIYKKNEDSILKSIFSTKTFLLLLIVLYFALVLITLIFYPGENIDIHKNQYYNLLIGILLIIIGLFICFSFSSHYSNYPKFLLLMGRYSLVIYIWHGYVISVMSALLSIMPVSFPLWLLAVINTVCACIICVLIAQFISRYLPFMIGNR